MPQSLQIQGKSHKASKSHKKLRKALLHGTVFYMDKLFTSLAVLLLAPTGALFAIVCPYRSSKQGRQLFSDLHSAKHQCLTFFFLDGEQQLNNVHYTERRMIIIRRRHFSSLFLLPAYGAPVRRNLPVACAELVLPIPLRLAGPLRFMMFGQPLKPEKRAQQTREIFGVAAFFSKTVPAPRIEIVGCF